MIEQNKHTVVADQRKLACNTRLSAEVGGRKLHLCLGSNSWRCFQEVEGYAIQEQLRERRETEYMKGAVRMVPTMVRER